jgi:hypothetical protein
LKPATGLIIAHGAWTERCDFGCFIHHGTGTAAIDWEAAIDAIDAGLLPGSGGEKRMLRLTASLAGGIPVRLGDAVTGLDQRNAGLLVTILHASGQRQSPGYPVRGPAPGHADRLPASPRVIRHTQGEHHSSWLNSRDQTARRTSLLAGWLSAGSFPRCCCA